MENILIDIFPKDLIPIILDFLYKDFGEIETHIYFYNKIRYIIEENYELSKMLRLKYLSKIYYFFSLYSGGITGVWTIIRGEADSIVFSIFPKEGVNTSIGKLNLINMWYRGIDYKEHLKTKNINYKFEYQWDNLPSFEIGFGRYKKLNKLVKHDYILIEKQFKKIFKVLNELRQCVDGFYDIQTKRAKKALLKAIKKWIDRNEKAHDKFRNIDQELLE